MPFDPTTLLMIAAMIALFYFMIIRPGQKRAKQQQEMTSSLQPGALIMTTAGVYGRVVHVGERQFVIEISPGVEMTLVKAALSKVVGEDALEFEYADDDDVEDNAIDPDVAAVDPVLADEPARSPYDAPVTDAAAGDAPASGPYTPPVTGQPSADAPRQTPDFRRPDGAQ